MANAEDGCVERARGPIAESGADPGPQRTPKEVSLVTARVGGKAPDFEASAFYGGGFKNVRLSDYLGHWVVLCFYPGDFTFV